MSSDFELERRCSYLKKPGIVQLTPTTMIWTPDSAQDGNEVRVDYKGMCAFQVTQPGTKKAMLRFTCTDESKVTLVFAQNFPERDEVRDAILRLQRRGRAAASAPQPASTPSWNAGSASDAAAPSAAKPSPAPKKKVLTTEQYHFRQKLLSRIEIRKLHASVVRTGAVDDEAFWYAMRFRFFLDGQKRPTVFYTDLDQPDDDADRQTQHCVSADAFQVDTSKASDSTKWKSKSNPSPTERHLLFMEHPAVARAMAAKVPKDMTELEFWEIFRQSSIEKQSRATGYEAARWSKTEAISTAQADALFAPFQAQEDQAQKREKEARVRGLSRTLDLDRFDDHRTAHVLEGHVIGGDAPRQPKRMRFGGNRAASAEMQLIQKLNRHGTMIVDEGAQDGPNWKEAEEEVRRKGRPLEDLEVEEADKFLKLGIEDAGRGAGIAVNGEKKVDNEAARRIAEVFGREMEMWNVDSGRLRMGVGGSEKVLGSLLGTMKEGLGLQGNL